MWPALNSLIHHSSRYIAEVIRQDTINQELLKDVSNIAINFGIDARVLIAQSVWKECVSWQTSWNDFVFQTEIERFSQLIECIKQVIKNGGVKFYVDFSRIVPLNKNLFLKKMRQPSIIKLNVVVERKMGMIENIIITTANMH